MRFLKGIVDYLSYNIDFHLFYILTRIVLDLISYDSFHLSFYQHEKLYHYDGNHTVKFFEKLSQFIKREIVSIIILC